VAKWNVKCIATISPDYAYGQEVTEAFGEHLKHIKPDVEIIDNLRDRIARLKQEGLTILLAEQNVDFSPTLADRVYALEEGAIRCGVADPPSPSSTYLKIYHFIYFHLLYVYFRVSHRGSDAMQCPSDALASWNI
jgi:energy-coupling factor transporter ATP-binding protein EcfA2